MQFQKKIVVLLLLFVSSTFCFSQKKDNAKNTINITHLIGLQVNPYLSSDLFSGQNIQQYVFAIRYGISFKSGLTIGPELSGNYSKHSDFVSHTINYGLFCRYTFLQNKVISPFMELSGYYQTNKLNITNEHIIIDDQNRFIDNRFTFYGAPGVSVGLIKKY